VKAQKYRSINLRPGDLDETQLRGEAIAFGYSNLSAYLRYLIKLGHKEFKKNKGGNMKTLILFALLLTACGKAPSAAVQNDCPDGQYEGISFIAGALTMGGSACTFTGTYSCNPSAKTLDIDIQTVNNPGSCTAPGGKATIGYSYTTTDLVLTVNGSDINFAK